MDRRHFIKGSTAGLAVVLLGVDGCTMQEARIEGAAPTTFKQSVCPYCGVGCGLEIGVEAGKVVSVRGMKDHPVNQGELCILGKNLVGVLDTPDRLLHPMRRSGSSFEPMSWDEAESTVATRIRGIIDEHGPDAFAMYVSASEYLEEYYVYNKFVKGCLGTNNLESSARLCWASGVVGLVKAFGADSPPCAYDDLDHADLMVVSGYNPSSSKPVFFRRLMKAKSKNGTPLIVIDPRTTDTSVRADLHLKIAPGTDVALHNAIAHVLIRQGWVDENEAHQLTDNYDALKAHVQATPPEVAAPITGLTVAEIEQAAKLIGEAKAGLFMWGQGLNQSRIGTRKVTTFLNLVFVTGNLGKPGAGPMAITGQTSAMGLREVGALPHLLPGFRSVTDAQARSDIAAIWGVDPEKMSANKGLSIPKILAGIEAGTIKALWVIHANPAATFPDSAWVARVLDKVELLIVQDCYHPTETTTHAHILLPGAQWSEKAGTLTNSERGLNLIEAAVAPPGEARPDLDIVRGVARAMGFTEQFPDVDTEALFEEYKRCTAGRPCDITGVTWTRLRTDKGIQWPVPTTDHPGTPRRFLDRKFPKGKLKLNLFEHEPPAEVPDSAYPLTLITGVLSWQFHSRTRTGQVAALTKAAPEAYIEIHPDDAATAGVSDGDLASLQTRRGSISARVKTTDGIRPGAVFVPYHFAGVNALTVRSFDEFAGQPEYKACAVRIVKA